MPDMSSMNVDPEEVSEEDRKILKLLKDCYGIKSEATARAQIETYKKRKLVRKICLIVGILLLADLLIPDPLPYLDEVLLGVAFIIPAEIDTKYTKKLYAAGRFKYQPEQPKA